MKNHPSALARRWICWLSILAISVSGSLWANDLENPPVTGPLDLRQWLSADYDTDEYVSQDRSGKVWVWSDRTEESGSSSYDKEQSDSAFQPVFVKGTDHPSGLGTVVFENGQVLVGDSEGNGVPLEVMDEILIVIVWRPDSFQNAVLWQQGNLSLRLSSDGFYGIAVDGILTQEVHSYREHEHIVSVGWITPGDPEVAELYHNTRPANVTYSEIPAVTASASDTATLGGKETSDFFDGEIQELLIYDEPLSQDLLEYLADTFEDAYNLSLDRTGDGQPDDLSADASWDGIPNEWLIGHGLNPFDPDVADQASDIDGLTWLEKFLLEEDLRGSWRLMAGDGTVAEDYSEFENDGTFSASGVQWVDGGYGIELDGQGEVEAGDPQDDSLDLGEGSLSMSVWFQTTSTGSQTLFSKGTHNNNEGYGIGVGDNGEIYARLGGNNHFYIRTVNSFAGGEWHHAVAVFDRDDEKAWIYVDGDREDLTNHGSGTLINGGDTLDLSGVSGPTATSDRNFLIGATADQSANEPLERFDGQLADVRLYDRPISETTINGLSQIADPDLDSDENGVPDWWQIHYFGKIGFDRYDDPDGDGYPLIFEYFHESDPTDPEDFPNATYFVDQSGFFGGFLTIHDAIDESVENGSDYDIIRVFPGVYSDHYEIDQDGTIVSSRELKIPADRKLLLIAGDAPWGDEVVIDRESYRYGPSEALTVESDSAVVGFTFKDAWGGIYFDGADALIADCRIEGMFADDNFDAGLRVRNSELLVRNLEVVDNFARGVYAWDGSDVKIYDSLFENNHLARKDNWDGGGIRATGSTSLHLERSRVIGNRARDGGGIYVSGGKYEVVNSIVGYNESYGDEWAGRSGGIRVKLSETEGSIVNSTFIGNRVNEEGDLHDETASGGSFRGSLSVVNSIFWNPSEVAEDFSMWGSGDVVSYSNIRTLSGQTYPGEENLQVAPGGRADGMLLPDSPLVEMGDTHAAPGEDIQGEPRPFGSRVDIGADEFFDTDGKGLPDWWQIKYFGQLGNDPETRPAGHVLTYAEEYAMGTDPTTEDTNGDGIKDGHSLEGDFNYDGISAGTGVSVGMDPYADPVGFDPFDPDDGIQMGHEPGLPPLIDLQVPDDAVLIP